MNRCKTAIVTFLLLTGARETAGASTCDPAPRFRPGVLPGFFYDRAQVALDIRDDLVLAERRMECRMKGSIPFRPDFNLTSCTDAVVDADWERTKWLAISKADGGGRWWVISYVKNGKLRVLETSRGTVRCELN